MYFGSSKLVVKLPHGTSHPWTTGLRYGDCTWKCFLTFLVLISRWYLLEKPKPKQKFGRVNWKVNLYRGWKLSCSVSYHLDTTSLWGAGSPSLVACPAHANRRSRDIRDRERDISRDAAGLSLTSVSVVFEAVSLELGKQKARNWFCSSWRQSVASTPGLSSRSWRQTPSWKVRLQMMEVFFWD